MAHALTDKDSRNWRVFELTTRVEVLFPMAGTRVWLPVPLPTQTSWQTPLGNTWEAHGGEARLASDPRYTSSMLFAQWSASEQHPVLELTSRVATRDRAVSLAVTPAHPPVLSAAQRALYLRATELLPTDGIVHSTALEVAGRARHDVDKARALYEWIVEHTYREATVRGCGVGDIKFMLESGNLGGKCADINALFVGMSRSLGIPARDVYGVRCADSRLGYKSLGKSGNITKAQHCRAEFWAEGHGWIPVDPADVRKVALEEVPGGLALDDARVAAARQRLFGAWEMNWTAFNFGHDLKLPGAARGTLGFLMYPQCETAEGRLDCLDADNFKYVISARELEAI